MADLLGALREESVTTPGSMYGAALPSSEGDTEGTTGGIEEAWLGEVLVPGGIAAATAVGGSGALPEGGGAAAADGCPQDGEGAQVGKVAAVCAAVLAALAAAGAERRLLRAALACHAARGDLAGALLRVRDAKEAELAVSGWKAAREWL